MSDQVGITINKLSAVLKRRIEISNDVMSTLSLSRDEFKLWQELALLNNVKHACLHSPFYQNHIPKQLAQEFINGDLTRFSKLPFTTRDDLMNQYPLGLLSVPKEQVVRFNESSGTSNGKPISAYFTQKDWLTNNNTVAHFLSSVLTSKDCVALAVPYELAGIGQDLDRSIELLNCSVVALGALTKFCPPERMVNILKTAGVTTLICSGTRALYLADVAKEQGICPKSELKVDQILFAGEGASKAKRRLLEETWGAKVYAMYGMTETNTLAMFCTENRLHLIENRNYFEVINPTTGSLQERGEKGELVVTSLSSEAMPLIRYRTGDFCTIDDLPCRCGSPFRVLNHMGRTTDLIMVGSKPISQLQLEDAIMMHLPSSPYYFSFKAKSDKLLIGLTSNNILDTVHSNIAHEILRRFEVSVEFTSIAKEKFVHALRTAAKPTMNNFLLDDEDANE